MFPTARVVSHPRARFLASAKHAGRLVLAALIGIIAPLAVVGGAVSACNSLKANGGGAVASFIDCETPSIADALPDLIPLAKAEIEHLINPATSQVDTTKLVADLGAIKSDLGRCAMAAAFTLITPTPLAADATTTHTAFDAVHDQLHWPPLHVSGRVM